MVAIASRFPLFPGFETLPHESSSAEFRPAREAYHKQFWAAIAHFLLAHGQRSPVRGRALAAAIR
jgi:hypothetical protein